MRHGMRSDLVLLEPGCPPVRSYLEPSPHHLEEELGFVICMEQCNLKLTNRFREFHEVT